MRRWAARLARRALVLLMGCGALASCGSEPTSNSPVWELETGGYDFRIDRLATTFLNDMFRVVAAEVTVTYDGNDSDPAPPLMYIVCDDVVEWSTYSAQLGATALGGTLVELGTLQRGRVERGQLSAGFTFRVGGCVPRLVVGFEDDGDPATLDREGEIDLTGMLSTPSPMRFYEYPDGLLPLFDDWPRMPEDAPFWLETLCGSLTDEQLEGLSNEYMDGGLLYRPQWSSYNSGSCYVIQWDRTGFAVSVAPQALVGLGTGTRSIPSTHDARISDTGRLVVTDGGWSVVIDALGGPEAVSAEATLAIGRLLGLID